MNKISQTVFVSNKKGLHARASASLTKLASSFGSKITLTRNGKTVDAKSIMGIMMLAAGIGAEIMLEAEGDDSQLAVSAIIDLFNNKFHEGE